MSPKKKQLHPLPHLLIEAVKEKRAILVFGAGASMEATNLSGNKPPNGDQLRDAIAEKFLGTKNEKRDLMTVAEMAISSGDGETRVFEEVAKLVTGFSPSEAHKSVPKFAWRGLVTTNYDILVESGYSEARDKKQNCVPFVKDAEPYDDRLAAEENSVPLLKLHGCVNHRLDEDIPLVLSHEHFYKVRKNRIKLIQRLEHWAESSVLIFIGFKLTNNHIGNLVHDIDQGKRPGWYIVSPDADEHDKKYWSNKNIDIVPGKFGEFIQNLENSIEPLFRSLAPIINSENLPYQKYFRGNESCTESFRHSMENDFEYIHQGIGFNEVEPKKFYSGYDNSWCCIVRKYDFSRKTGDSILYSALEDAEKHKIKFLLLYGSAGGGKTIALKRAAFDAATALEQFVLWLKPDGIPRIDFFQELYGLTGKRTILFVDQVSLHQKALKKLLISAHEVNLPLTIIAADREADWSSYCSELEEYFPPSVFYLRRLIKREVEDLVDLLTRHDCLGMLKTKNKKEQVDAFMNEDRSDRQLLVALHELTQGKPFEEIIREEYQRIIPDMARYLYLDIATMHQYGVVARAGAISRISGVRFESFEKSFFTPLKDIVRVTSDRFTGDKGYQTRHTRVSRIVFGVACSSDEEKAVQLARIISGLDSGFSSDRRVIESVCKGRSIANSFSSILPAREIFEMACSRAPDSAFLFQQYAILEYSHPQGSLDYSEKQAETARSIDDNNHIYLHTLAEVKRRKAKEATNPVKKEQLRAQSRSYLNEIWLKDAPKALTFCKLLIDETLDLERSLSVKPKEYEIIEFEDKVNETINRLRRAKQDFPDASEFQTSEAQLWQHLGDSNKAKKVLEKAIQLRPNNSSAYLQLANICRKENDSQEAYNILNKGLDNFPTDKNLHLKTALNLLEDTDEPNDQIDFHFRSSFAAGDHNFDARFYYAEYLFWKGKIHECVQAFLEIDKIANVEYRTRYPKYGDVVTKKLSLFQGVIEKINSRYAFIRFGGYPKLIFVHFSCFKNNDFDELEVSQNVSFELRFNRKGPIAVNAQTI